VIPCLLEKLEKNAEADLERMPSSSAKIDALPDESCAA